MHAGRLGSFRNFGCRRARGPPPVSVMYVTTRHGTSQGCASPRYHKWHSAAMALARIILHVGPPRTGTTSIQAALSASRRQLLEHGVYYPSTEPETAEGQHFLAWDVLMKCGKPVAQLSQENVSWDESLMKADRAGAHTLLVSSEEFSSDAFDATAFLELRRRLTHVPVHVVFALRDPRRLVVSIWSHSVRWGLGSGEELLSLGDATPLIMTRRNVRVVDYLTPLEEVLQPVQINFLTVPRKINRTVLLERFEECCELPIGTIAGVPEDSTHQASSENAALPLRYLLVLLRINQAMSEQAYYTPGGAAESLNNSIEVRRHLLDLLLEMGADDRPEYATLPAEFRSAAEDLGRSIVRWVSARGAHVSGDLRDVWDENRTCDDRSGVRTALTEAEINRTALNYLAATASAMQGTIDEIGKARDFWQEQASGWEKLCLELRSSWSWKLSKPLRLAGPLQSIFKPRAPRSGD